VAVSNYTASFIKSPGKLPPIHIIPNAVDIDFLKEFEQGSFVKLPGNPAVLTVGNVTPRKGQHNMIKALPKLKERFPGIHYHCVGLKSHVASNLELAKSLGVEQQVTFHGKLSLKSLMSAYRGCDVFAMTSEHLEDGDFEGFGIAILEANFFGKPAIGSKGCGIEDAISEGQNGFKVDAQNPETILEAVTKCLSQYDSLSTGARLWSEAHHWDIIAGQYISLFN
jgi:phosphatidylinositol alpha-1,6-mannosyltransferase